MAALRSISGLLAALLPTVTGCGEVYFVDPQPPQLHRFEAEITSGVAPEPVVWLTVTDLFVEQGSSCDAAISWARGAVRSAMQALPGERIELQAQDVSADCQLPSARIFDPTSTTAALAQIVAAHPATTIRPVIVYANNIALSPPGGVAGPLQALVQGSGGYLWAIAPAPVAQAVGAKQTVAWSYTFDPALPPAIAQLAAAQLPLESEHYLTRQPAPILDPAALALTRELKFCSGSQSLEVAGLSTNGGAVSVSKAPTFWVNLGLGAAQPKGVLKPRQWKVDVESCSANCDRLYARHPGDLQSWNSTAGCFL